MDERKNNLLKVIVETYIKTVKPVGSKALCDLFGCSSATIRNEMAILEEMGYLEKNHISSGRVPSEAGYRYYVKNLMEPEKLTGSEMLQLQKIFANTDILLSDAINKCMDIISDITNYTSVVLGKSSVDNNLLQINIIDLRNNQVVAVVCTDKGNVENKTFNLPDTINVKEVIKTSEIINKMLVGTPINDVGKRLELEVKPVIKNQIRQYETVYNIFYDAFNDFVNNNSNIHVTGKTKIFEQPEYSDINELKRLANKLEDNNLITKVEEVSDEDDIKVYIGDENEFDSNCTIIRKKYHVNGEEGTIAVIGPKRMDYQRIVGLLEYIDDAIDNRKDT
ncbi:heat-inducible transcription repressor hrcA [Clostridium sp. CAG:609]|nr:heat-inducible transcription repressor hrcA [Clostridium sp. CAG:609]